MCGGLDTLDTSLDMERSVCVVVWTHWTQSGHGEVSVCCGLDTLDTSLDMERSVCVVVSTELELHRVSSSLGQFLPDVPIPHFSFMSRFHVHIL